MANDFLTAGLTEPVSRGADLETVSLQSSAKLSGRVQASQATGSAPNSIDAPDLCGHVLADRYVLISSLGKGGMGEVFKALDSRRVDLPEGNRYVAVKVLHRNLAERSKLIADLRREFYCAQTLSHPNIVKVYEMDRDGDLAFFTMEWLQGERLSAVIERARPQPLSRPYAWSIIRDVGAAVAHAHSRHVAHGDLKPQNIMVTDGGEVRLLDFGASGLLTRLRAENIPSLHRDSIPPVTPAYTCCELLDGRQTDPRDDLFALACLSYELLSGSHPFKGRSSTEARALGMVPERPPGLTHRQWLTLRQGLAWQRENRTIEVGDWLANLGLKPETRPVTPPRALLAGVMKRWESIHVRRWALCASVAAVLVGALLAHSFTSPGASADRGPPAQDAMIPPARAAHAVFAATPVPNETVAAPGPDAGAPTRALRRNVTIAAANFRVLPGEGFAEVEVVRSATTGATRFEWWTEGSSAKPGSDFVPQQPTTQSFSKGRRTTKVYVRILRNQSRQHSASFYVVIGKPNGDATPRTLARATVWVPSEAGTMVASN